MIVRRWLAGEPLRAGDRTVVPLARGWQLRLPGGRAGAFWLRPAGVAVRERGGRRFLPVRDPTRWLQLALLAAGLAAFALLRRRRRGVRPG
jgi:hypothetical protein